MLNKKITAVYFSATGTNRTTVCTIAGALSDKYLELDLTGYNAISEDISFNNDEMLIIGAPVYSGRIYKGAVNKFTHLKGNNTPCIVTVTYGNRHYDDALIELYDLMRNQGFYPVAAAALIGQHTFGEIQAGRPNRQDQNEDIEFALKVSEKFNKMESDLNQMIKFPLPGNHPYMEGGNGGGFTPLTSDTCISCELCVSECPENAIAKDCRTIDSKKCISCFRCIRNCPIKAKNMDTKDYNDFAAVFSARLAKPRSNEYFM
jgi:ferredoxin